MTLDYLEVQSKSRPWIKHIVTVAGNMPVSCTCENWIREIKKHTPYSCKHMNEVWAKIVSTDTLLSALIEDNEDIRDWYSTRITEAE